MEERIKVKRNLKRSHPLPPHLPAAPWPDSKCMWWVRPRPAQNSLRGFWVAMNRDHGLSADAKPIRKVWVCIQSRKWASSRCGPHFGTIYAPWLPFSLHTQTLAHKGSFIATWEQGCRLWWWEIRCCLELAPSNSHKIQIGWSLVEQFRHGLL